MARCASTAGKEALRLTVESVLLDVLDSGFDLALALRVVAFAGADAKAGRRGVLLEALVQRQLPERLGDDHQTGLIVDALFGTPPEGPKGRIVHADQGGGVHRSGAGGHVHQARV